MVDFQLAILPTSHPLSCRGYDQLVIAQSKDHAKQHLRDLRKMIIDSPKYSKYLINKPNEIGDNANRDIKSILKDEQSKTSVIYIHNPENPSRPSRIIALGIENDGAILSWKMVKNIHMSDITAAEGDIEPGVNAAMTRLANTDGSMIIETIPGLPVGKIYDMWRQYRSQPWSKGDFKVFEITSDDGIKAGIMTPEFIESERKRLGTSFPRYYGAQFLGGGGNMFPLDKVEACISDKYNPNAYIRAPMALSIDPAFSASGSRFAILITRLVDGKIQVIYSEEFLGADFNDMVEKVIGLIMKYRVDLTGGDKIYIDGSNPELIRAFKRYFHERTDFDEAIKQIEDAGGDYQRVMKVVPVYFGKENVSMVSWLQSLVSDVMLMIHPQFKDLLTQMKSAILTDKHTLDKGRGMPMDSLDSLMENVKRYHY